MPSLHLTLCIRVFWGTANVIHALIFKPSRQLTRDVTAAVVTKQPDAAKASYNVSVM